MQPIHQWRGHSAPAAPPTDEAPLRAELLGLAQLATHAKLVALGHEISRKPGPERLRKRLRENAQVIRQSHTVAVRVAARGDGVAPAAEWLLDNFYLIEDQIDLVRDHLPHGFAKELPLLARGARQGSPRVYDLALELVAHTDGRVDLENLAQFTAAYQSIHALDFGELWALPVMLRLALLENIRRVARRVAVRSQARSEAAQWAERFLHVVQEKPRLLIAELAELVRLDVPLTHPFVMELTGRLQAHHAGLVLVLNWLDQQLAERGQTLEQIRQAESQEQAADQVSMGNCITSLRTLTNADWPRFIENQSVTEAALRRDPLGTYPAMDFRTRDAYRHVVEELAKRSPQQEQEVAAEAVRLAAGGLRQEEGDRRHGHVGYYLLDKGRAELERAVHYRPSWPERIGRAFGRRALATYFAALTLWTAILLAALALLIVVSGRPRWWWMAAFLALALPVAVGTALALTNWLAATFIKPRGLPRLDYEKGIPDNAATLVVVPTMLTSAQGVELLVEGLATRFLANRGPNLSFVLLSDWSDAPAEKQPQDLELLDAAAQGIEQLNQKYAAESRPVFFLVHRARQWNPAENTWMGRERKRGKLADFNELIRTGNTGQFIRIVGDLAVLRAARFVITLDTDTQLPPGTAWKMAGALAHPLNRPWIDPAHGCVTLGYSILQPRVAISLVAAGRSWFSRLFAGEVGIDPYTREVSNIYHDLFGQAQFIGKGIYDVSAFDAAVGRRFPDNTILSHDLIEGCHARCGFLNDVELIEEHPVGYLADVSRRHRWVRGDWQILPFLRRRVRDREGHRARNSLDRLSRWMILDNARRSLTAPMLLVLLLAAWSIPGISPTLLTLGVIGLWCLPQITRTLLALVLKPRRLPWPIHLRHLDQTEGRQLVIELLSLVFLPFEAWWNLDAIIRVLWRRWISHRRLLEWQPAHEAERRSSTFADHLRHMAVSPLLALLVAAALVRYRGHALPVAAPLLLAWLLAPWIAWRLSKPREAGPTQLTSAQLHFLGRLARRTWNYFDAFMVPAYHFLPPDNYQEQPVARVAERTSATNIALGMLSTLAAVDLGYISIGDLIDRLQKVLSTIDRLERYRGHLLNWYSTAAIGEQTCPPLRPRYVSTVDSGNLCVLLITLRGGLLELIDQPILAPRWRRGFDDTVGVLREEIDRAMNQQPAQRTDLAGLTDGLHRELPLAADLNVLPAVAAALNRLNGALERLVPLAKESAEVNAWLAKLRRQCDDLRGDLAFLAPWLANGWMEGHSAAEFPPGPAAGQAASVLLELAAIPTLTQLANLNARLGPSLEALRLVSTGATQAWVMQVQQAVAESSNRAAQRIASLRELAQRCDELTDPEWAFLYAPERKLFVIGYNLDAHRSDTSTYDLLASEARVASYLAVAQNKVPQEHWFALGRQPAPGAGPPALVSWSGSMFEYLMPPLIMPRFPGTLLDQTCQAAVQRQIRYGRQRGVYWGISESGFNLVDAQMNYQYRAFGVPDLGLKRGLADDLVVAPYASAMALIAAPREACANLQAMAGEGLLGPYGLYEAIDYTPSRLAPDQKKAVVQSFMAHHSGMSLLALDYVLAGQPMQRRFLADPECRAAQVLLQERVPLAGGAVRPLTSATPAEQAAVEAGQLPPRRFRNPSPPTPEVHLLSNSRYHLMITSAGGSSSQWNQLALTRWREDITRDAHGLFLYLQDVDSGRSWSPTFQPLCRRATDYEALFLRGRAEFRCVQEGIEAVMHVAVSPEDDIELRRLTLSNISDQSRTLELTSYAEVVLQDPRAEAAHPVFNNLFVQTQALPERSALLATRRPRGQGEQPPWLAHLLLPRITSGAIPEPSFETSRVQFIGRGRTPADPAALDQPGPLSGTAGTVLDPIVALRHRLRLLRGQSITIDVILAAGDSQAAVSALIDRYHDRHLADRVFEAAWTHSQVLLHELRAKDADADLFGQLAGALVYPSVHHRAAASVISRNRRGQSALWSYGISGDLPIVLLRISEEASLGLLHQVLQAQSYWRLKGLRTDLMVWCDAVAGYRQSLLDQVVGAVNTSAQGKLINQPGGVFIRATDQVPEDDRVLLQAVARLIITDSGGSLRDQSQRRVRSEPLPPQLEPIRRSRPVTSGRPARTDLEFFNGLGGFTSDGREYVVTPTPGGSNSAGGTTDNGKEGQEKSAPDVTPAPWSQVLANGRFGSVLTESSLGYTWLDNAHEFRLTPWNNDPVTDAAGEAIYLRDEETGQFWSPTALPAPAPERSRYICRHGLGYTTYEAQQFGIQSELSVFVGVDVPVKFLLLTLRNNSGQDRRLSATGYVEWVLGDLRSRNAMHVVTRLDPQTSAILAGNGFNHDFPGRCAFYQASEPDRTYSGDRTEFLGRNGAMARPAALRRQRLSNRLGAGLDPCAAIQVYLDIPAGQERQVVFILGAADTEHEALTLLHRFGNVDAVRRAQENVWEFWKHLLGGVHVETPDPSVNFFVNHWLLYQVLTARFWGRSGYYQSGGAYGFRDQLQDAMCFIHECPWLLRAHLLNCACHQFREGDVQHWWHPPMNRGVRTNCSDDYLFLPYAVCRYVRATADTGVLDEITPFLEGRPLGPDEESYYDRPSISEERGSLYEHCVRAIRHGIRFGAHGLPLMGGGDWNDGLNHVGHGGKGESVWLGFFLQEVLAEFAPLAESRGEAEFAAQCRQWKEELSQHVEAEAWDGQWYRRAYFDDGTPLGSAENPECRIDLLPQAWAVLSGSANPERARQAMRSALDELADPEHGMLKLFAPPFDQAPWDPGYIKGYVPGVRENGGQYTHAAVWTAMAFAQLHQANEAWQVFNYINPICHGDTPERMARYQVEPYAVAADIYSAAGYEGRGGWTWYTGSAAWTYRLLLESLLGLQRDGESLRVTPVLPADWPGFTVHYRYRETMYHIHVEVAGPQTWNVQRVEVDGAEHADMRIPLADDHAEHQVHVRVG